MGAVKLVTADKAERRASPRITFGRQGTLRIADRRPCEVMVSELTREGCRIHTDLDLSPDLAVTVGLAHVGLTSGRIVWRSGRGYGCRFDQPLVAGAVTAAGRSCNVSAFPLTTAPRLPQPQKLSPLATLTTITSLVLIGWATIGMVVEVLCWP